MYHISFYNDSLFWWVRGKRLIDGDAPTTIHPKHFIAASYHLQHGIDSGGALGGTKLRKRGIQQFLWYTLLEARTCCGVGETSRCMQVPRLRKQASPRQRLRVERKPPTFQVKGAQIALTPPSPSPPSLPPPLSYCNILAMQKILVC